MGRVVAHFSLRSGWSRHARPPDEAFERRVQRFDNTETNRVITVRGDAVEVLQQRVTQLLHFRESLVNARL
jgi:hypothetical protein